MNYFLRRVGFSALCLAVILVLAELQFSLPEWVPTVIIMLIAVAAAIPAFEAGREAR